MSNESDSDLLFEILESFFIERDTNKLCEIVLNKAMDLTQADGGTLYLTNLDTPRLLDFAIVVNKSLNISMGGTSGNAIRFPSIEISQKHTGKENHSHIASYVVNHKTILNIEDAYHNNEFDFTGMKVFDKKNNYHSKSFLVVPLLNHYSEVVGVIQLINAKDNKQNKVISFNKSFESILRALANFSALALENSLLANEKNQLLINLLAETDADSLLQNIIKESMKISRADTGMIYMIEGENDQRQLHFEYMTNKSLDHSMNRHNMIRHSEHNILKSIALFDGSGKANSHSIMSNAAIQKRILNIPDVYQSEPFDCSPYIAFDKKTGYKTQSLLVIPFLNHDGDVIGVIQLINAIEPASGKTIPFSADLEPVITALTQYAAIVVNLQRLLEDHRLLLDSFVKCIAGAIDEKSPHTSAHCQHIPVIMDMMVDAISEDQEYFPNYSINSEQRYEIQVASWLHDCGKLTTPDSVLEKSTKLHKMQDSIHEINNRFLALKQQIEIQYFKDITLKPQDTKILQEKLTQQLIEIEKDRSFIEQCNIGSEFMDEASKERVKSIANAQWTDHLGTIGNILNENEVYNLCITKGTLNDQERTIVNNHMQITIDMLESLHFPKHLKQVPEIAGGHHEKMNGKGFPKGLTREEMSIPARMMAIADIFEALTSQVRPYKSPMKLSQTLSIMSNMVKEQHIDPELFAMFLKHRVWEEYAKSHLQSEQLDISDISAYLN